MGRLTVTGALLLREPPRADYRGAVTTAPSRDVVRADIDDLRSSDAFLRWSIPSQPIGAWTVGSGVAVAMRRAPRSGLPSPWLALLGDPDDIAVLVNALPSLLGDVPGGVTTSAAAFPAVSSAWDVTVRGRWDYMATSSEPPPPQLPVRDIRDAALVNAVLDAGNTDAHARPGDPEIHCWLGADDEHGLACVGALTTTVNGGAHLRAITTVPRARSRGFGVAVSTALTARGLAELSPEVTLGVYTDNVDAIRLYERLGYRRVHRLVSALVTR